MIIGNGTSRKRYDLHSLRDNYETYGCNAIWRDFVPDFIVAIDPLPIYELMSSGDEEAIKAFLPTVYDDQFEPFEANPNRPRNNAGMVAMKKAIDSGHNKIVCIGFDFLIQDAKVSLDNVYCNTYGYGGKTQSTIEDNYGRLSYLAWFIKSNPDIIFEFVYPMNYGFYQINLDNIKVVVNETL